MAAARRTGLVLAALCLAQLAVIAQVSKLPAWPLSRSLGCRAPLWASSAAGYTCLCTFSSSSIQRDTCADVCCRCERQVTPADDIMLSHLSCRCACSLLACERPRLFIALFRVVRLAVGSVRL